MTIRSQYSQQSVNVHSKNNHCEYNMRPTSICMLPLIHFALVTTDQPRDPSE